MTQSGHVMHECDDHEHHGDEPDHMHDMHECDDDEHHTQAVESTIVSFDKAERAALRRPVQPLFFGTITCPVKL